MKLLTTDLGLYTYCPIFYRESKKDTTVIPTDIEFSALRECLLRAFKHESTLTKKITCKSFCSEWDNTYWKQATEQGLEHKDIANTSIKAWIWLTNFYKEIYSPDASKPLYIKFTRDHTLSSSMFLEATYEALLYSKPLDSIILCSTTPRASLLKPLKDDIVQRVNAYLLSREVKLPIILRRYILSLKSKPLIQELKVNSTFHQQTQAILGQLLSNIEGEVYWPSYSNDCKTCPYNDSRCSI